MLRSHFYHFSRLKRQLQSARLRKKHAGLQVGSGQEQQGNRIGFDSRMWHGSAESAHEGILGFHHFLLPSLLGLVCPGTFGARGGHQHGHVRESTLPTRRQPQAGGLPEVQVTQDRQSVLQYGKNDDTNPTDCNPVPQDILASGTADEKMQYRPGVLADCVCTPGTECKDIIANAGVAAVASTIFVRIALGTLLERFGPVNVQSGLMTFGAFWVAMAAAITAPWNYTLIRFFIGCAGAG